jgi:hypothetical protein
MQILLPVMCFVERLHVLEELTTIFAGIGALWWSRQKGRVSMYHGQERGAP